ncbi:MAG TPA: hypothetical protein PLO89_11775 [Spirochaetota bacterium]|nr:hypothetical protein [Spirochaetota bacterium]
MNKLKMCFGITIMAVILMSLSCPQTDEAEGIAVLLPIILNVRFLVLFNHSPASFSSLDLNSNKALNLFMSL